MSYWMELICASISIVRHILDGTKFACLQSFLLCLYKITTVCIYRERRLGTQEGLASQFPFSPSHNEKNFGFHKVHFELQYDINTFGRGRHHLFVFVWAEIFFTSHKFALTAYVVMQQTQIEHKYSYHIKTYQNSTLKCLMFHSGNPD